MPPSASTPGPLPTPPADLLQRDLPLGHIPIGEPLYRMHAIGREPIYFSKVGIGRFDAPAGEFGSPYLGTDVHCAFIATFGRDLGYRAVARAELIARSVAIDKPSRALQLVDLTGRGLARLGADARLWTGDDPGAQQWSMAFWEHPREPGGLLWRSRFDPSRTCVGLYDRAHEALRVTPFGSLMESRHQKLLAELLKTYQFGYFE